MIKLGFMVFGLPNEFNSIVIAVIVLVFIAVNNNPQVFERLKQTVVNSIGGKRRVSYES